MMEGRLSKPIRVVDDNIVKLFSIPLSKGEWVVDYRVCFNCNEPTFINNGFVLECIDSNIVNEKMAIGRFHIKQYNGFYNGRFVVDGGIVSINCKYNIEKGGIEFDNCWYKVYQVV